jgi:hypothetical protein
MIGYPEYIVNNTGLNEKYKKLDIDQVHFLNTIGYPEYIVKNTGLNKKYKSLDVDQVYFLMIIQYDQLPRVHCQQYRTQRESTRK